MKHVSFKEIFSGEVESPAVILVEGDSGTLKSTLCFNLMLDVLRDKDVYGLYVTLEQTWESHLDNMKSLGYSPSENLLHADYNKMRKQLEESETSIKILDSALEMVESVNREKGGALKIFTLDSLNAAYSIMDREFIQFSLIPFFERLRERNLISLIIYEKFPGDEKYVLRERFLADGIISLGIHREAGEAVRYLQALKYTQVEHSLKRRVIATGKDGISILGSVYR
jgi:KaiC/GvpD/RAD55 family RecA-like ATPase